MSTTFKPRTLWADRLRPNSWAMRSKPWASLAAAGAASLALMGVSGCANPPVQMYAAEQPALDLRQYLNGSLTAHGIFTDRSGKVVKRFVVDMTGQWSGEPGREQGVLDEHFTDLQQDGKGQKQRRVWRLQHHGDGRYTGQADDVVGVAQGQTAGNAFHWTYTLQLPVDGRVWEVQFDDWMYLVDERIMLNKAVMSKWGIRLGEVTLVFTKPDTQSNAQQSLPRAAVKE